MLTITQDQAERIAYVAFQELQKEASEVVLTLEFDGGRFVITDTIRDCIRTWTFCRNYHEYDKKHQVPTVD